MRTARPRNPHGKLGTKMNMLVGTHTRVYEGLFKRRYAVILTVRSRFAAWVLLRNYCEGRHSRRAQRVQPKHPSLWSIYIYTGKIEEWRVGKNDPGLREDYESYWCLECIENSCRLVTALKDDEKKESERNRTLLHQKFNQNPHTGTRAWMDNVLWTSNTHRSKSRRYWSFVKLIGSLVCYYLSHQQLLRSCNIRRTPQQNSARYLDSAEFYSSQIERLSCDSIIYLKTTCAGFYYILQAYLRSRLSSKFNSRTMETGILYLSELKSSNRKLKSLCYVHSTSLKLIRINVPHWNQSGQGTFCDCRNGNRRFWGKRTAATEVVLD